MDKELLKDILSRINKKIYDDEFLKCLNEFTVEDNRDKKKRKQHDAELKKIEKDQKEINDLINKL